MIGYDCMRDLQYDQELAKMEKEGFGMEIFDAKVVYKDGREEVNSGELIKMAEWVCEKLAEQECGYAYARISKREVELDERK